MTAPGLPSVTLRPAAPEDCTALTALCLRSKAWHGYDAAFMAACRDELTVTPERLARGGHCVAWAGDRPVGFMQVMGGGDECWLEALFIEPDWMGRGLGRRLFAEAEKTARARAASQLVIESDPGAVPFYRQMGARDAGFAPSGSIAGRTLPRLVLPLHP